MMLIQRKCTLICNVLKVKQPEKSTVYAAEGSIKLTALIYYY